MTLATDLNAALIATAHALSRVSRPLPSTFWHAKTEHADKPLPEHLAHRFTAEQWAERCRKEHNRAVRRCAQYVAAIRKALHN